MQTIMVKARAIVLIAAICVVGCTTPYQAKAVRGGYLDSEVGEDLFEIEFWGNGFTSREKIDDFATYRCVELTFLHGGVYFSVLDTRWASIYDRLPGKKFFGELEFPRVKKRMKMFKNLPKDIEYLEAGVLDARVLKLFGTEVWRIGRTDNKS